MHLRRHLRHHGRGKEGRNGPRDHQKRGAAEIFSKVLHAQTDAGQVLRKYFPRSYTPKQMQDTIIKLLEQWQKKRQRSQER